MCAGMAGHHVIHWIFDGHQSRAPETELVRLTPDMLVEADPFLVRANKTLRRKWPVRREHTAALLRRNYYQIAWSGALYAVSHLDGYGQVAGGTAWAVQMFIDRFQGKECPVYLYDQKFSRWLTWGDGHWEEIDMPPKPSGIYGAVGSRNLLDNGKRAIRTLLEYRAEL
jgi:hypothetical protein